MSAIDTDRFRTLLLEERARVQAAIENLERETAGSLVEETGEESAYDNHLGDLATATYDRELEYGLEEGTEQVLEQIDAALKRVDEGTYGICRVCGQPIGEERLEAVPYADLCIEDRRRLEGGG
jgi:RNA polymerase-binding protein DksA